MPATFGEGLRLLYQYSPFGSVPNIFSWLQIEMDYDYPNFTASETMSFSPTQSQKGKIWASWTSEFESCNSEISLADRKTSHLFEMFLRGEHSAASNCKHISHWVFVKNVFYRGEGRGRWGNLQWDYKGLGGRSQFWKLSRSLHDNPPSPKHTHNSYHPKHSSCQILFRTISVCLLIVLNETYRTILCRIAALLLGICV